MTRNTLLFAGALVALLCSPLASRARSAPQHGETVSLTASQDGVPAQTLPEKHGTPPSEKSAREVLIGTYSFSTGFGAQEVTLQRDGTYSLSYYTDVMNGADLTNEQGKSFGVWSLRQEHAGQQVGVAAVSVVLTPTDATRKRRYLTEPLVLYPVRWQQRLYLLRAEDFVRFRDSIVAGYWNSGKPRFRLNFLLRDGDGTKAVRGLPDFPLQWRSLLKDVRPVVAPGPALQPTPLVISAFDFSPSDRSAKTPRHP